jgi:hypothetical protein
MVLGDVIWSIKLLIVRENLERAKGIEPSTYSLGIVGTKCLTMGRPMSRADSWLEVGLIP